MIRILINHPQDQAQQTWDHLPHFAFLRIGWRQVNSSWFSPCWSESRLRWICLWVCCDVHLGSTRNVGRKKKRLATITSHYLCLTPSGWVWLLLLHHLFFTFMYLFVFSKFEPIYYHPTLSNTSYLFLQIRPNLSEAKWDLVLLSYELTLL